MKRKTKKKAIAALLLIIADIALMMFSGFHLFNLSHTLTLLELMAYAALFVATFCIYGSCRYRYDAKDVGKGGVTAMLTGMLIATFGASNIYPGYALESDSLKTACTVMLILGTALYCYFDYMANNKNKETFKSRIL